MEELIVAAYMNPHHLLNVYIKRVCGVTPSDGEEWDEVLHPKSLTEDVDMEIDKKDVPNIDVTPGYSLVGLPKKTSFHSSCLC